jgi:hypothetical protein
LESARPHARNHRRGAWSRHLDVESKEKATIESFDARDIEIELEQHNTLHMTEGEPKHLVTEGELMQMAS